MFLMSSEILSTLSAYSGLKLNHKKLSQAFEKLGYGKPISKRIDCRSPRKVYSVRKMIDEQENTFQRETKKDSKNKKEDINTTTVSYTPELFNKIIGASVTAYSIPTANQPGLVNTAFMLGRTDRKNA